MGTRWALCVLAAAALTLACGDSTRSTPSPEAIATAESVARNVTFGAEHAITPESGDDEKEPIVLDGRVFGRGAIGVILSHMRPSDQTSWFPFATELAQTGQYTVLTFDFRGYGASTGEKQFDRIDADLKAALDYMEDELGIKKVFLVGASMGGTASLIVAASEDVAGVVAISAPGQFPPLDAVDHVDEIAEPKLFVTSEDDVPQARSQEEFWKAAPEPKEQHIYEGNAHGTAIFDGPNGPDLERRIVAFLRQ